MIFALAGRCIYLYPEQIIMNLQDSIGLSWKNVKGNKLRTFITVMIMALGIFALILIITAIQAATNSMTESFATMGANSFSIRQNSRNWFRNDNNNHSERQSVKKKQVRKSNFNKEITIDEARAFKERYEFPGAITGIALRGAMGATVTAGSKKTSPEITVFGGDENYLFLNGYTLFAGRNLTPSEVNSGSNVVVLGNTVARTLFGENISRAVDAQVNINNTPYRVLGVLEEKNSSAFFNTGKVVITSYNNVRRVFNTGNTSYLLAVNVPDINMMNLAIGEAQATFRPIRRLPVTDDDNFGIDKSDSFAEALLKNLGFLQVATIGIAFITLIGAAIGLMNIMLVAVNERTKEIGLSKALGSTKGDIRRQFLFESIIISLLGAVAGIAAGVLIGNVVALLLKTGFVVPWLWVIAAVIVCSLVGLLAGWYPAYKASKLDPIVALRYE